MSGTAGLIRAAQANAPDRSDPGVNRANGGRPADLTHQVPQPEIPMVWITASTHWRKKMKKKAMKLKELSALQRGRGAVKRRGG